MQEENGLIKIKGRFIPKKQPLIKSEKTANVSEAVL
jgi:hypothetical protein